MADALKEEKLPKITAIWTKDGGVDLLPFGGTKSFLRVMGDEKRKTAPDGHEKSLELALDKARAFIIVKYVTNKGDKEEFWIPREHLRAVQMESA